MIQHTTTWLILTHYGGIFCRQEPPFSASQSSETQSSNTEIVLSAHRDLLPKGSVKHNAVSKSLLKEGMLAYHINSCYNCLHIIIIDMAIPLTRANRLAAMRESDERITSIFHTLPVRPPAFYLCPIVVP